MKISCPQIIFALDLLKSASNEVVEVSCAWSAVKEDYRMKSELSNELREKIKLEQPALEYWKMTDDDHYAAEEGFICHDHKISISFPVRK